MKILVINSGSSSLKYQLIDMETEAVLAKGNCDRIGIADPTFSYKTDNVKIERPADFPNHQVAVKTVLATLADPEVGVISDMKEIDGVGHRVVASGEAFKQPTLVTPHAMQLMEEIKDLAPLHNPAAIIGVNACLAEMPDTPMVLVFDTGFHFTMPDYAYMYAIKYEDYEKYKIRRYGAHGTSHKYVAEQCAKYLNVDIKDTRIITCHLGNGSSITAVKGGKCIDTSMGFTPLAGVPMGSRSGDIDFAAVEYLAKKEGKNISEMLTYLNKECGMRGISGGKSDFRDLTAGEDNGDYRCKLALEMFCYATKKYIGAYMAAMDGVDAIVFTAGIGEHVDRVRAAALADMDYFGIKIDPEKNLNCPSGQIAEIQADDSRVKVLVIPTNEELAIARETMVVANLA